MSKVYGLMHVTWLDPACFFYDSVEAAEAAIEKAYGKNSGHRVVVRTISEVPDEADK